MKDRLRNLAPTVLMAFACLGGSVNLPARAAEKPAKLLFGKISKPADLKPVVYGYYTRGCLAGAEAMPHDGPAWQVMRPKRNRNWGHPSLIEYLKKLATDVREKDGWPGLLIGDISQPRGGPMLTGHKSHQLGLDADVWMMPMPKNRRYTRYERNEKSAVSMLATKITVDRARFLPGNVKVLRRAAASPRVARIFVHPAIKKALCKDAGWFNRGWLAKIRPWWGHHFHFHVRLNCPPGDRICKNQNPPPAGDGCGKPLDDWIKLLTRPKKRGVKKKKKKPKKRRLLTLAQLPPACRTVLNAGTDTGGGIGGLLRTIQATVPLPARKPF